MQVKNLGCFTRVYVSSTEVYNFNKTWPCSNIPEKNIWFEFDSMNGDLIDLSSNLRNVDGPELVALSQEAQEAI